MAFERHPPLKPRPAASRHPGVKRHRGIGGARFDLQKRADRLDPQTEAARGGPGVEGSAWSRLVAREGWRGMANIMDR